MSTRCDLTKDDLTADARALDAEFRQSCRQRSDIPADVRIKIEEVGGLVERLCDVLDMLTGDGGTA